MAKERPHFGPENLAMNIVDGILTIQTDLTKRLGATKSGKSATIASTGGNRLIEGGVRVGLNVYFPMADAPAATPAARK